MWEPVSKKTYGIVTCHFQSNVPHGLTLNLGDLVEILEQYEEWCYGINTRTPSKKGIFPASYVQMRPIVDRDRCSYYEDPVVEEATCVIREWSTIWKQLYVKRETSQWTTLGKGIMDLIEWRRQLMTGTFTQDHLRDLRLHITSHIDWGNRKLGLDLVPRIEDRIVQPESIGVYELYKVHVASAERNQNATWKETSRNKSKNLAHRQIHHLYFSMRHFGYPLSEDVEVQFSLYDTQKSQFISEKFLVKVMKEGFCSYLDRHTNCATLFTDIGGSDFRKDLYLVVQVIRLGRLIYTESSKKHTNQIYRRPYAIAVLNLNDAQQNSELTSEEKEFTLRLYQSEEKDYGSWHDMVAKKLNSKFSPLSGQSSSTIVVALRLLHGELAVVKQEYIHLLKNVQQTKKLGFPDVIMPGDIRNDLYLTLMRGDFERGVKSSNKNIEVTVLVIDESGETIKKCLYGSSNDEGLTEYHSIVLYHVNSPMWMDMVKVFLPIEKYYGAHVRLEFRHCSTKDRTEKRLFGFSFTPLMDKNGTVLQDGNHQLVVYKCEDVNRLKDPSIYTDLVYSMKDINSTYASSPSGSIPFQRNIRESITVGFCLCSTKLTQNTNLLSLLKWKAHPEKITETLNLVMYLRGEELVKFLQDVLDSLFAMFSAEDGSATPHSGLVFQVLVSILSLLEDSKFEHFKPVVDAYIANHFSAALVYRGLISCVQQYAVRAFSVEKQEVVQKCFRTFEMLFKLIVQSRILYTRATGGENEEEFCQDIHSMFASFNKMLTVSTESAIPLQIALLENIFFAVEQLLQVLPKPEVAQLLAMLIESIPKDPAYSTARIKLVLTTVKSSIFTITDPRAILLPTLCRQIRLHLFQRIDLHICTEALGHMMNFYRDKKVTSDSKVNNVWYHDVEIISIATLDVLIQAVLTAERAKSNIGPLVACLLSVLELLEHGHYDRLWIELLERTPLKDFLLRLFLVLKDLIVHNIFPSEWRTMHCLANRVILTALEQLATPLITYFLDSGCFDTQLWSSYFNLAVDFLTQPCLQLENCSESQRKKMLGSHRDMRVLMGFQILSMWNAIGDYKIHFIPSMVGPFLQVTLVPEPELRKATLPMFFDMMDCEQRHRGNFKQVESELIDKLDVLVGENKGDNSYKELFNTILLEKVKSCSVTWKSNGTAFINSITKLLERLLDYRNVMEGEENRDKRMSCTFNLLKFYKNEVERRDMYLRYVHKLHDLHISADNFTEAAFTLQLHASQLNWSSNILPADEKHITQQEWQRKELLYMRSISLFDRGKCWEKGIQLCKELAEFYETRIYDYKKLSYILRMQANFFDNIMSQLRPEPEYFRVGFYGCGFPLFLRNKLFVYRGLEYERIGAFTQRLQTEFSSATILTKNTPPGDSITNSGSQYIQICNVKPIPDDHPVFDSSFILPESIRNYHKVNDVSRFQLDRPVHKGAIDKENEFKSLWIERTTLLTENSLPGILRWFEVTEYTVEEIPPVQFACETVASVNKELQQLTSVHKTEPKRNINPFSMRLQGVIDANVMGGIAKYQEAFFTPEFKNNNPAFVNLVHQLRQSIMEQMKILDTALALHGKLAPADVQPLHKRLVERLMEMKQRLKEWGFSSPNLRHYANSVSSSPHHRRAESDAGIEYGKQVTIVNTSLPPLPIDKKSQRSLTIVGGSPSNRSSGSSSSLYGQFVSDEEDLYCKPSEIIEKLQAGSNVIPSSPASISSTPVSRSSRAKSPHRQNEYIFFAPSSIRDSGFGTDRDSLICSTRPVSILSKSASHLISPPPFGTMDDANKSIRCDAPPLPPRLSKVSLDDSHSDSPPPIHPKRIPKKYSLGNLTSPDVVDAASSITGTLKQYRQPPPPPLPPKAATPLSPIPLTVPPPIPPHRAVTSPSFSNNIQLDSGSLVDEVCSLLAIDCQGLPNGKSPSPPTSPPPPIPDDSFFSKYSA